MDRVYGAIGGGKGTLAVMLLAAGLVATGCGDAGVQQSASQSAPAVQTESMAELPKEESASGSLDETAFAATRISQCQATPGHGLGIRASTEDFVGQSDIGVQVFGGFEKGRGKITVDFRGTRWTAGEGSDGGSLEFVMTDMRNQLRQFVIVRAHGSMVSDQGRAVPFDLTLVCEPGGT